MCNGVKLDKEAMCWESIAAEREGLRTGFLEEGACSKRQSK